MGTRIPLQNDPNYIGIDIDRDSVEDASTTYEYIKEAVFDQYRVDYLASTSNLLVAPQRVTCIMLQSTSAMTLRRCPVT